VPNIKILFEDILFTDKNFSENEIFDKFENIIGDANKESLDIAVDVLIEFKNDDKKSERYPLIFCF